MSLFDLLPINGINNAVNSAGDLVRDALGIGKTKSNAPDQAKFSFEQIKSEVLNTGLASESRFEVFMAQPTCLAGTPYGGSMQSSLLRLESVTFPALTLYTKNRQTYGPGQAMPIGMDYGGDSGVTLTFVLDRDMWTKKMFDAWMDCIVDYNSQTIAYPDTYRTQMMISQLDKSDGSVYMAVIDECYPKIVSSMQGNSGSQNHQRVSVTFAYRKWKCRDWADYKQIDWNKAGQLLGVKTRIVDGVVQKVSSATSTVENGFKNAFAMV
jgi:hypothetical protein